MPYVIDGQDDRFDRSYNTLSVVTRVLRPVSPAHCEYLLRYYTVGPCSSGRTDYPKHGLS